MSEIDQANGPPGEGQAGMDLFARKLPMAATSALAILLIVLFAAVLAVAILLPIPETIRCAFVLVPEGGADPVRAPREGVLTEILVVETQGVRKGQDLFVIRNEQIRSWTAELRGLEQELEANARRVVLVEADQKATLEIQTTKLQQLEKDLAFQQEYLATLKDFLGRYEKLDADGLVSRVDIMSQRLEASKGERDVAVTRQTRDVALLELEKIRNDTRKQLGDLALERRKAEVRVAALEKLLGGAQEDVIHVVAPFDGTVVVVQKKNQGDVVSYGQELCSIARSDSTLIAYLTAPESGVPRLRVGLSVQLFFEAYPYERFGTGHGTIRWISPAAVASADREHFIVHVVLDAQTFGATGSTRALRAGMSGQARIVVGKRTLIEYVFEPLRKLRENVVGPS
jgi:membrane fusion protein